MGVYREARDYRQQHSALNHAAASAADDANKWADELADKLVALINAQARTPSKAEITNLLLKSLGK
jgi:hypothetical protein